MLFISVIGFSSLLNAQENLSISFEKLTSEKQQYIQLQLTDLANKEKNLMFQLDQVKASQQVFKQAFIDASKEVSDEVLEEKE